MQNSFDSKRFFQEETSGAVSRVAGSPRGQYLGILGEFGPNNNSKREGAGRNLSMMFLLKVLVLFFDPGV